MAIGDEAKVDSGTSSRIAAVILAAGMSRRMGQPKALLDVGGRPLIERLVRTAAEVRQFNRIVVVTGHEPPRILEAFRNELKNELKRVSFVQNDAYESGGMLSSVKIGCSAVEKNCDAFFLMLLDQPLVRDETLVAMLRAWQHDRAPLVTPVYNSRNGHPLLIDSACIASILALPSTATLRDFVSANRSEGTMIPVNDPGVITTVDTPDDYRRLLELWNSIEK